jgi:aspartate racemase
VPRSPLPWLHIGDVVADQARARGYHVVGIMGTRWLVDSDVYPEKLAARGIDYMRPTADERDETHRIIIEELLYERFTARSEEYLRDVIDHMKNDGCDAVALGCTELPLVLNEVNSPLPVLDSTRLLARAAVRRATGRLTAAG